MCRLFARRLFAHRLFAHRLFAHRLFVRRLFAHRLFTPLRGMSERKSSMRLTYNLDPGKNPTLALKMGISFE